MDSEQILALYDWAPGVCFRHPAKGKVETTQVSTLHTRQGADEEVRACEECVLEMEAAKKADAERSGVPYSPGSLTAPDETA